ncbi:HAMP domain-containing histidine kinase [Amycolatopsis acidiphila]|uniref:histidine kinase n=1 Tax=Amycolatopsis acidiphila TaxID=715473 RepID=A0A557ZYX1_9PSEU|nr:HAMP domain-containing sensor histidine kinase [Amycolatopsis acidiphila]TVT17215.1 HAMP domain-containing histidine kinase [Amycolatopsis acidiphila]UIJ58078.1 HAMP domain-containing histidine kinase [Amycolatopsis acidiphila]GHG70215.1 two-component sensor histidine kinase [Amycolatopsis acidiphila]
MSLRAGLPPVNSLRARITLLATGLAAGVSLVLLWLAWTLVGDAVSAVPQLPPGTTVRVDGIDVDASALAAHMRDHARDKVLLFGSIAFFCVVAATAILAWTFTSRVLRPLREITGTARRLSVESFGQRIGEVDSKGELAELAHTFDAMLDRLQAAFEAQRHFVANASHELRTPLSVIRTELDVTLSDPDADAVELRRMANVVRDATERAGQLVNSLLLLARTDGTGLVLNESTDLATLVSSAWRAVRGEADQRDIQAKFSTEHARVHGDPALLERIAGNLLENAVRHNVEGGWIEVVTQQGERWSTLRVRSSGGLVDPATVAELFEPFRRAGVARTARSGVGLGLSIVRAAVEAHGGSVWAEPVVGGGLSVTVQLPSGT